MTDAHLVLAKAAGAMWERYRSTVLMGGTGEQRRWAFDQALKAEEKLAKVERALEKRAERGKLKKAFSGAWASVPPAILLADIQDPIERGRGVDDRVGPRDEQPAKDRRRERNLSQVVARAAGAQLTGQRRTGPSQAPALARSTSGSLTAARSRSGA